MTSIQRKKHQVVEDKDIHPKNFKRKNKEQVESWTPKFPWQLCHIFEVKNCCTWPLPRRCQPYVVCSRHPRRMFFERPCAWWRIIFDIWHHTAKYGRLGRGEVAGFFGDPRLEAPHQYKTMFYKKWAILHTVMHTYRPCIVRTYVWRIYPAKT